MNVLVIKNTRRAFLVSLPDRGGKQRYNKDSTKGTEYLTLQKWNENGEVKRTIEQAIIIFFLP